MPQRMQQQDKTNRRKPFEYIKNSKMNPRVEKKMNEDDFKFKFSSIKVRKIPDSHLNVSIYQIMDNEMRKIRENGIGTVSFVMMKCVGPVMTCSANSTISDFSRPMLSFLLHIFFLVT